MLLLPQEGKHEKTRKAPQTQHAADKSHQLLLCVRAIIARRVCARECVFVCGAGAFVLLRELWQAGRCECWEASKRLAEPRTSRWPFTQKALSLSLLTFPHSLLNMLQLLPPSIHSVCVRVCASLFCLQP